MASGIFIRSAQTVAYVPVDSCLDDSELELLGASWPEYERVAREVKLDVLRFVQVAILGK